MHILGPTETVVEYGEDSARVTEDDIEMILSDARSVIPNANIKRGDILRHWAGLRPATYEPDNPRGAWKRRFYGGRSEKNGAFLLSMSWGRLCDHKRTASIVAKTLKNSLSKVSHEGRAYCVDARPLNGLKTISDFDTHIAVSDIMFGRTGWGWDKDFGISKLEDVSEHIISVRPEITKIELKDEYKEYIEGNFGVKLGI